MTAQKHSLTANGAPFSKDGDPVNEDLKTTTGEGRALCSCGWTGPLRTTGAARRADHKEHKAAPGEAPEVVTEETVAPEAAPAPEAPAEDPQDLLGTPAVEDEEDKYRRTVQFTDKVASMFFRYFGREGTQIFLAHHFPTVSVTTRSNGNTITVKGDKDDVEAAIAGLEEMWDAAAEAVKVYIKTDEAFLARPRKGLEGRKASFEMKSRFLVDFAAEYEPLS